jgi:hypothetical protein
MVWFLSKLFTDKNVYKMNLNVFKEKEKGKKKMKNQHR